MLRSDFSGGFSKPFGAQRLGFIDALPLIFAQPGYDNVGIYFLSLENIRSTLRDVLSRGGVTIGVPSKQRRSP